MSAIAVRYRHRYEELCLFVRWKPPLRNEWQGIDVGEGAQFRPEVKGCEDVAQSVQW